MIAIDTNLLVYAHRAGTPEHARAKRAIERAAAHPKGWGIAQPCLAEFWSVVTHPSCPPRPSKPEEARNFLSALLASGGGEVWLPGPGLGERLMQVAADNDARGARIFDLQIALIAFEGGATELWSHDGRFQSVRGLPVHDPLA